MAAWHALIRSHARVVRRLEAELEMEQGLTLQAYEVLAHLSESPERRARMSDLAAPVVLSPRGLTPLGDKLVAGDPLARGPGGGGARVVFSRRPPKGVPRARG